MHRSSSVGSPAVRLITLTTDLGAVYAAQMKAVLCRSVPAGQIVDLAHDLAPHGVLEAAFVLRQMAERFPAGTIHVAVVDPGVGGTRAPIAVECLDGSVLIGPDNGVLDPLARRLGRPRAFSIDRLRLASGGTVSPTFEGRDVFAPAAARVATGVPLSRLGTPWRHRRLVLPTATKDPRGASGIVLHVDRFGNVITNVPNQWAPPPPGPAQVRFGDGPWRTAARVRTYEEIRGSDLSIVESSFGSLELALKERSAHARLGGRSGTGVRFRWRRPPRRGPAPGA